MEKDFVIDSFDKHKIYGLLAETYSQENLIIFVHGLSGSMTEAHYFAAKEYFIKKGYNVCRFNLYSSGEGARLLHTSTIAHHVQDVEAILGYFSPKFKNIYLVGHSLGGPSIIGIQNIPQNLEGIILWDPAFDTRSTLLRCVIDNGVYLYIGNGKYIQISQQMYMEFQNNTHISDLKNLPYFKDNINVIYASAARHKSMIPQLNELGISYVVIEGANHGFTQEGKYEELFENTLEFIKK